MTAEGLQTHTLGRRTHPTGRKPYVGSRGRRPIVRRRIFVVLFALAGIVCSQFGVSEASAATRFQPSGATITSAAGMFGVADESTASDTLRAVSAAPQAEPVAPTAGPTALRPTPEFPEQTSTVLEATGSIAGHVTDSNGRWDAQCERVRPAVTCCGTGGGNATTDSTGTTQSSGCPTVTIGCSSRRLSVVGW